MNYLSTALQIGEEALQFSLAEVLNSFACYRRINVLRINLRRNFTVSGVLLRDVTVSVFEFDSLTSFTSIGELWVKFDE